MAGRRWSAFAALATLTMLIGVNVPRGHAQGRGTGWLLAAYRETGGPRPAWVTDAVGRSLAHLARQGKGRDTLQLRGADLDDLATHVRLDQVADGVPVFGGQLIVHLDSTGAVSAESGRYYAGVNVTTTPSLAPDQALAAAQQARGYPGQFVEPPTARLLILPQDGQSLLVYQVTLKIEDGTDATAHHQYFVDAHDGHIVHHFDSLPHEVLPRPTLANVTGSGQSLYSGTVSLGTDSANGTYYLRDNTRGGMYTTDMQTLQFGNGAIFTDSDNSWGDGTNRNRQTAGVDAHFGAAQTWDYYLTVYGRRGIDGNGYQLLSRVHYGQNYNNAFWNGTSMTYGDGDGKQFRPLVALDVVGHEITHGVTEQTADLIYENESGAANESFSDIFGSSLEYYTGTVGGRSPDDWIGEDIYVPESNGFRNMGDPREDDDPDHYSERYTGSSDNGGVHTNSGIQNHAFYLLVHGGQNAGCDTSGSNGHTHTANCDITVTGIGRSAAAAIFYRALTAYLFPRATFQDVRAQCLQAAADLYGANSTEYKATAAAWTAVGVE